MAPMVAAAMISAGASVAGSMLGSRNAPVTGEIRKHMPRYLDMNSRFFNQQQGFSWRKAQTNAGIAGRYNSFYQGLMNANSASAARQSNANSFSAARQSNINFDYYGAQLFRRRAHVAAQTENRNWSRFGAPLARNQARVAGEIRNRDWGQFDKPLFRDQAFTASQVQNDQWGQFGKPLFQDQQRTIAQSELSNLQATSVGRGQAERAYLDAKFPGASTWDLLGSGGGAGAGAGAIPGAPGMPAPSPGSVSGRGVAGVDPRMVDAAALQAQSELKGQYQSELVAQAAAQETQAAIVKAQMKNQMGIAATNSIAGIIQAAVSSNESPSKIGKTIAETKKAMAEVPGAEAISNIKSAGGLVNEAGSAIRGATEYAKDGLVPDLTDAASKLGSKASDWTAKNGPHILRAMEHNYNMLQQQAAEMSHRLQIGLERLFNKHGSKSVRPVKRPVKSGRSPNVIYINK